MEVDSKLCRSVKFGIQRLTMIVMVPSKVSVVSKLFL